MQRTIVFCVSLLVASCCYSQPGITKPVLTPAAVVQTPMPAVPAASAAPVPGNYLLGTEDALMVTVWREPTLTGPLVVRPDGNISLPLIGDVKAAGLKPMALSAAIADRLMKYITNPLVTVTVTSANSQRIYFIGEVARPGPAALAPEMTLLQAISSAGGLTAYADAKHIYILRGAKGNQQKIAFDYKKAVKQGNQQGIVLTAGDTIVVP